MIVQHHDAAAHAAVHAINVAAIAVPVGSWLGHAPEFFTATAGACGTAWYIMYFTREYLHWRRKRREQKAGLTKATQEPPA